MNNQPIGVLDSGVGGLTIWKEIVTLLPQEYTIYIADSKNCPYGSKTSQEIYQLARRLVQFLIKKNCKLIVLACNTITVSCLERLRKEFSNIPIVGTVPVIKTAAEKTYNKKIGILSTIRTARSNYQENLVEKFASECEVINIGTDRLVPLIEKGSVVRTNELQNMLQVFINAKIDVLALGCSHFPLIKEQIQQILGPKVVILDSGPAIARQVKRVLEANSAFSKSSVSTYNFYTTGKRGQLSEILRSMGYNMRVYTIDL